MPAMPTPDESLCATEVDAVLRAMTPAQWEKALRLARFRAAGLPHWSGESLLAEALAKLLAGDRVWRRGVDALVTLANVMHSLASNDRKKERNAPIDRFATVDMGAGVDEDEPCGVSSPDDRSPMAVADAKSQLAAIEKLVEDDEDAQMVLMAWAEGLRGKEAAADLGFDMKRYDAARKRLERKLKPLADLRNTQ